MAHGFPTAEISGDEYDKLRANHRARWLTFINPNFIAFAARINQSGAESGTSFAGVIYDTVTVGAYTDVKVGWTVYFSHTSDIHDFYFRGRIRALPTSNTLYINQTSISVDDSDYIFVTKDTRIHEKLPHKFPNESDIRLDYGLTFRQLLPIARGLPPVVVGKLNADGYVDFPFTPNPLATTYSASITTHDWDSDGNSFQVGSSSTENVTIRVDTPGWYEFRYTMTDSGGRVNFQAVVAIVYPADYSSIIEPGVICSGYELSAGNGQTVDFDVVADADLNLLDGTMIVIAAEDNFGGEQGSIITNIKFFGHSRSYTEEEQADRKAGIVTRPRLDADSLDAQLGRLILATIALRRKTTPALFGEIANLTIWRAIVFILTELCTVTNVTGFDFDNVDNTYLVPLLATQDRSAADSAEDIVFAINALLLCSTTANFHISRDARYMSSGKGGLATVANWTNRDYTGRFTVTRQHVKPMGRVIGFGGSYNTTSGTTMVLRARAPAVVWGTGEGRSQFNRQVLAANISLATAKDELAYRTGAELAVKNLSYVIDVQHPSGYDNVLFPAGHLYFTWTHRQFDDTKNWLLWKVRVRYIHEENRTESFATYVEDLTALDAQVVAEVAPSEPVMQPGLAPIVDTPFPGFQSLGYPGGMDVPWYDGQPYTSGDASFLKPPSTPTGGPVPPAWYSGTREGSVVLLGNADNLWLATNFARTNSPNWKNITPGDDTVHHAQFSHHHLGGWCLIEDGDGNTLAYRTEDIFAADPFQDSVELADIIYKLLGAAGVPGTVYAYAPNGGSSDVVVPANAENGGNGFDTGIDITSGQDVVIDCDSGDTWSGGFGSQNADGTGTFDPATLLPSASLFSMIYRIGTSGPWFACGLHVEFTAGTTGRLYLACNDVVGFFGDNSGDITATVSSGGAVTRYSDDDGETFEAEKSVGDSPGDEGGFHTRINSDAVLAAMDGKVREASAGGSYSDATGGGTTGTYPLCIWSYGDGDSDDFFLKATPASVSGESLWKVEGGTATAITPNDGSNDGLAVSPGCVCTAPDNDDVIFGVFSFGGTRKFARSTDGGGSWAFVSGFNSGANWVRAKNSRQVYVANGSNVMYSEDGGVSFISKSAPGTSLTFLEVR